MATIDIRVMNWAKFNPRADRGNFAWLRFQNSFFSDQAIFSLPANAKLLFVFLCCEASKNNSDTLSLESDYIAAMLRVPEKDISSYISALCSKGLVKPLKDRSKTSDENALPPNGTERNGTEQDGTERTEQKSVPVDSAVADPPFSCGDDFLDSLFMERRVTGKHWKAWSEAFPDPEWVKQEIRKAVTWELGSPKNRKRNFAAFVGRWLSRGWDTRAREAPRRMTRAEELSDYNQRMHEKILKGEV